MHAGHADDSQFEIAAVTAREILDSRGNPTMEADVVLRGGAAGRAAVPSGASTGEFEALELRDGGNRYGGRGVLDAVEHVEEELAGVGRGVDARRQRLVDARMIELDATAKKERLGANAILAVSLAAARAAAAAQDLPLYRHIAGLHRCRLPVPQMNIINGGEHADNNLDFQEFMVIPQGFSTYREALRAGAEVFHALKGLLTARDLTTAVGDEGGFAPDLDGHEAAFKLLVAAVEEAGYRPGEQVALAIDAAATELWDGDRYHLEGQEHDANSLVDLYEHWADRYPLISIEDGLGEEDWQGWERLNDRLGDRLHIVGDDLFVTDVERLRRGITGGAANAVLVKVNQIGTLSETLEAVRLAQRSGWRAVISHRSGETADTTIADLAVGTGSAMIKTGAPSRGERTAKYNRLLRIEAEMGDDAPYAGAFAD